MQVWSSNDTELIAAGLNVDYAYPRYFVEESLQIQFSGNSVGAQEVTARMIHGDGCLMEQKQTS
jgi:hypothetical protein